MPATWKDCNQAIQIVFYRRATMAVLGLEPMNDHPEQSETSVIAEFSGFKLDFRSRSLTRGGERVPLTAKPLDVLLFLVSRRYSAVTKKELLDAVWKETFVTEDNLTQAIKKIRRALGDDNREPRFILTIPRVGYQFIAEVATRSGSPQLHSAESVASVFTAPHEQARKGRRSGARR
ncbi:MAG: transcriptional regulator, partial [Acidobacteriota bacterium]